MLDMHRQTAIGIVTIIVAAFLILVAIPTWVSSPSNVPNIILSPLFWPYTLAALTGLVGVGLVLTGRRSSEIIGITEAEVSGGFFRLGIMTVIMGIYMFGLPRIGMVWTSMIAFAATAFLVHTTHPKTALICAIIIPLVLYTFFAHVAGVAIPQGLFVRLP
jgi:putative tricarboxylic transport membrane protein